MAAYCAKFSSAGKSPVLTNTALSYGINSIARMIPKKVLPGVFCDDLILSIPAISIQVFVKLYVTVTPKNTLKIIVNNYLNFMEYSS